MLRRQEIIPDSYLDEKHFFEGSSMGNSHPVYKGETLCGIRLASLKRYLIENLKHKVMNKLFLIFISFLLSFGFTAQSEGQTLSKSHTELIKNQVDSIFQKMVVLAEKLDFNELSSGVDDTNKAGFIVNGKYYADYSSLIDDVKLNAQGISQQDISIKEKNITVLSDRIVILTALGVSVARINDGREISANILWSFVYEKINNNWKVIYSHQSTTR